MKVNTIHGEMDDSQLERRDHVLDNANEFTNITEYWLEGELVHRSVHVTIKQGAAAGADAGSF